MLAMSECDALKKAYDLVVEQLAESGNELAQGRATIAGLQREHKLMADKIDMLENALYAARFKANYTPAPDPAGVCIGVSNRHGKAARNE